MLPPVELADYLSKLYGGEGWVGTAIRNLWQSTWDPWESDIPTEVHCIKWPSKLSGLVWIKFWPTPATLGKKHTILLQWGPWECILTRELPECGITLSTGKAIDEVAVVCMITTNYKVHLLHGSGTVEDAIDIRGIWSKNPRRNQIKN
ncbi:MAG: hypothetical protein Q4P66_08820 [Actinomycetaceae bacterium]|nr:hypothetical protein [Actinomycetaceae bacterium]